MNILVAIILIILSFGPGLAWQGLLPGEGSSSLELPSFCPPAWTFLPAWALLSTLLALGSIIAFRAARSREQKFPWVFFLLQGVGSFLWFITFFQNQNLIFALVELIALIIIFGVLAARFFNLRRMAGWLIIPYLASLLFILILTYNIYLLNQA